jgi:hypothetical protein
LSRDSKARLNPARIETKTSIDMEAADRFVLLFKSAVSRDRETKEKLSSAED